MTVTFKSEPFFLKENRVPLFAYIVEDTCEKYNKYVSRGADY